MGLIGKCRKGGTMDSYKNMTEVKQFRFYCQKVLPLVYDESLSYYEVLGKLIHKVNEITEQVNVMEDNIDFLNDEVIVLKRRMTSLENDMVQLRADFEQFRTEMNERFANLERELRETLASEISRIERELTARIERLEQQLLARIAELENEMKTRMTNLEINLTNRVEQLERNIDQRFDDLNADIDRKFAAQDAHINAQLNEVRTWVANELSRYLAMFENFKEDVNATLNDYLNKIAEAERRANKYTDEVAEGLQKQIDELKYDPTPRIITPADLVVRRTQDAFDVEHCYLRAWALTAEEAERLGLTAEMMDNIGINVYQHDYLNKWYYGVQRQHISDTIVELETMLRALCGCGLTAIEYDAKEWTAEGYQNLDLTAIQYDCWGCCGGAGSDVWDLAYNSEVMGLNLVHISGEGHTYELVYNADNKSLMFTMVA
jgi:cell division septum initiation protein DivIVA